MLTKNSLELQPSEGGPALSGCWKLALGRAISLQPRTAGVLCILQGRVWATFDGPHPGHGNESGDHFLLAGEQLAVRAGQRLVVEPWSKEAVYFEWRPAPSAMTVHAARWKQAMTHLLHGGGMSADRRSPFSAALFK